MAKVSVIVPVFNTGNVLLKTIDSIRNQTFRDFQCVLVDDGSDDHLTSSICQKIVAEDYRFEYFKKENEGIERTRLYGVAKSISPLLIFCDHDDYYEHSAFEKLYSSYLKSDSDIVCANCFRQRIQGVKITRSKIILGINQEVVFNHSEFIKNHYLNFFGVHTFPVSTWGKLYKKSLFGEKLELYNVNILEDIVLNLQLFDRAKKIHFIDDFIYTHIYGGISSDFDVDSAIDGYNEIYFFRKKYLEKYNLPIKPLLIEYKNIINQRIDLMIDGGMDVVFFKKITNKLIKNEIFKDILLNLSLEEQGVYIKYIAKNRVNSLHKVASEGYTITRKIKHNAKMAVKFLN